MTATTTRATSTAGWHDDPTGRFPYRYWDGASWTGAVSDGATSGVDPVSATLPETSSEQERPVAPDSASSSDGAGESKFAIAAAAIIAVTLAVFVVVIFVAAVSTGPANDDSIVGTDAPVVTEAPATTGTP